MDEQCSICGHIRFMHIIGPEEDRDAPDCPSCPHISFCADCDEDDEHEFVAALPGYRHEVVETAMGAHVTPEILRAAIELLRDRRDLP